MGLSHRDRFQEPIENEQLSQLKPYWSASLESESDTVYRAEYLAYSIIYAATKRQEGLNFDILKRINIGKT